MFESIDQFTIDEEIIDLSLKKMNHHNFWKLSNNNPFLNNLSDHKNDHDSIGNTEEYCNIISNKLANHSSNNQEKINLKKFIKKRK